VATFAEYSNRYDRVRSQLFDISNQLNLIENEVQRGAVLGDPDFVGRRLDALDNQIDANIDALNALSEEIASSDLTASEQDSLQRVIDATGNGYIDQQQRIVGIRRQAQDNQRAQQLRKQTQPKNSAGEIVGNEQDAQQETARLQSPQQSEVVLNDQGRVVAQPDNTNTATNAREPNTSNDVASNAGAVGGAEGSSAAVGGSGAVSNVGGDAPVVKSQQTQRTNNGQPGIAAQNDDNVTSTRSSVGTSTSSTTGRPTVAKEFLEPIISQPNILSGLSSMTYGLSLYLMSPDEYGAFVANEQKVLPTQQLLMQSAGATKEERNPWFNVDFYIEDFSLESVVGTQATGSPHNAITLEFTVVEPQGITFFNRLNNAVIDHISSSGQKLSAGAQNYLMLIRFYGYDAAGNLVTSADLDLPATSDSDAIIEKYIPFTISNFAYKIQTKATEYRIKGVCVGTNIAFSTARGIVPFNTQITASTIDQLFNGNLVLDQSQNANNETGNQSGTTQTVVQGLVQALNEQQQRLVDGGSIEIPDQYEIVFQDPDIKNAKIVKPGNVNKSRASNQTAQSAARKYLTSKLNYDKESQTYNVLAGTQIVQLLDLVLRTSSYITGQQDIYIDEKTGKAVASDDPNGQKSSVPTVQWYRVKTQVLPLGYDNLRKTMAYRITYIVNKYQINTPRSAYFPPAEYRGVHKLYEYWFTGKNTEVLDFEIDVNYNYYTTIGNDGRVDTRDQGDIISSNIYNPAPGQSQQGGVRGSTIPAANLSDRLYSPADVAYASINIVGDPDWIQQSELVYNRSISLAPFLPDGGVNYDSSEVLFEIRFNPVQDYNLETGLSDVYENNREVRIQDSSGGIISETNVAQESLVFQAITVTSNFADGQFTQQLKGVYRPLNSAKNAPVNAQAETVLSNANSTQKALANTDKGDGNSGSGVVGKSNNGLQPKNGVTTKNENQRGIVVEIVPNDIFPDDDAGFRIDSRGNRTNFNIDR